MENKKFFDDKTIKAIILSAILGTSVISLLLILCALLMSFGVLPINTASVCSTLSLSIGAFLSGLFAAKSLKKNGMALGAVLGAILFLIFTAISLIASLTAPSLLTLLKGIIMIVSSALGGILGVNIAAKRKII